MLVSGGALGSVDGDPNEVVGMDEGDAMTAGGVDTIELPICVSEREVAAGVRILSVGSKYDIESGMSSWAFRMPLCRLQGTGELVARGRRERNSSRSRTGVRSM